MELRVPEILQGFSIDWSHYEPPCGRLWHEFAGGKLLEGVKAAEQSYQECYDNISKFISHSKESVHKLEEIKAALDVEIPYMTIIGPDGAGIKRFVGETYATEQLTPELPDGFAEWAKQTPIMLTAMINGLKKANALKNDIEVIKTDLDYLHAITGFFAKDEELDMCIYSLGVIDVKYRTKIFRHAYRVYKEVEDLRFRIDHTKSTISGRIMTETQVGSAYRMIIDAYKILPTAIRTMKKSLEEKGDSFWRTWGSNDDSFLRMFSKEKIRIQGSAA